MIRKYFVIKIEKNLDEELLEEFEFEETEEKKLKTKLKKIKKKYTEETIKLEKDLVEIIKEVFVL